MDSVKILKLVCNIKIGGHTKKSDKTNKKRKRLQLQGEIGEITINCFIRKMKGDLNETFKIIDGISNYGRHFLMFLFELKMYCQGRFQNLSLLTNKAIYF